MKLPAKMESSKFRSLFYFCLVAILFITSVVYLVSGGDETKIYDDNLRGGTCTDGYNYVCNVSFLHAVVNHTAFNRCYGDADGNGFVNPGDRGFISVNVGTNYSDFKCLYDIDGNGFVNPGDRGFISVNVGLCTPLPDFQNGAGTNH